MEQPLRCNQKFPTSTNLKRNLCKEMCPAKLVALKINLGVEGRNLVPWGTRMCQWEGNTRAVQHSKTQEYSWWPKCYSRHTLGIAGTWAFWSLWQSMGCGFRTRFQKGPWTTSLSGSGMQARPWVHNQERRAGPGYRRLMSIPESGS